MTQSLTNMINLIASVITILGGVGATIGAFMRWRAKQKMPPASAPPTPRLGQRTWPPATVKQPAVRPHAQPPARGVSHATILGFSLAGLLTVTIYSVELLVNQLTTGSTGVAASSPLIGLNTILFAINLICVLVVGFGAMITAFRGEHWVWVAASALTLAVSLITIGIFSVVALAPGVFYGLNGPRESARPY